MPIRTSSFTKRIADNGAMLHQARMDRIHAQGADHEPSEAEQALAEARRLLKEERATRQARAHQPGPTALDKLVRTHHAEVKEKPKAAKEAKASKGAQGRQGRKAWTYARREARREGGGPGRRAQSKEEVGETLRLAEGEGYSPLSACSFCLSCSRNSLIPLARACGLAIAISLSHDSE